MPFPNASARANAVHVVREHVATYLITHPHLDHLSGFVINTAAFHNTSKPKRLAALPFTVNSIKTHIFNDVIWPNLTDEDGGVGFVTFQRLAEGGNIALGDGHSRGYIEVCDGLGVKGFKVSHGNCMRGPGHIHRASSAQMSETGLNTLAHGHPTAAADGRSLSISQPSQPGTPLFSAQQPTSVPQMDGVQQCVIDSSAYFIRTDLGPSYGSSSSRPTPAREILIFGDVEPDTLSLSPRTAHVWQEAAPKIAAGILTGVFIECSYTDAQGDAVLFGHLAPRHLIAELQYLADMVREARKELDREREELRQSRKRKRSGPNGFLSGNEDEHSRRRSRSRQKSVAASQLTAALSARASTTTTTVETTTNNVSAAYGSSTTPQLLSPGERVYMRDYLDTPIASATSTPGPDTPRLHPQQQTATHQQQPPTPSLSISVAGGTSGGSPTTGATSVDGTGVATAATAPQTLLNHHPLPPPHPLSRRTSFLLGPSDHGPAPNATLTAAAAAASAASAATTSSIAAAGASSSSLAPVQPPPLKGLRVVVIHVKDTHTDGPLVGERILEELVEHERVCAEQLGRPLGCEFVVSRHGGSYWF